MASGRRVAGAIRSLVYARSLQLECARVLHESLECDVRLYGMRLLHVSEFTYLRLVSDESGRNDAVLYKGGKLQVLLGPLLTLGICSLSVLGSYMRHYLRLF